MAAAQICSFCKEEHGGPPCPYLLDAMAYDLKRIARKKFQVMYNRDYNRRMRAHIRSVSWETVFQGKL